MLFALLLFLVYFGIGVLVVLSLWAIRLRFGNASELDPQSWMVRLFGKKSGDSARFSYAPGSTSLERRLDEIRLQLLRELSDQGTGPNKPEQPPRGRTLASAETTRALIDESLPHKDVQHTVDELVAALKGGNVPEQRSKGHELEDYPELALGARIQ